MKVDFEDDELMDAVWEPFWPHHKTPFVCSFYCTLPPMEFNLISQKASQLMTNV